MTMIKKLLAASVVASVCATNALAEGKKCKEKGPFLWGCTKSIDLNLNDEKFTIKRSGAKKISSLYESTHRGAVQPFNLAPGVETLGEKEFIHYMYLAQTNEDILVVDSRKPGWHASLRIPGTVNMPFTDFKSLDTAKEHLEDLGGVQRKDGSWDFSAAKTIVAYCNGYWCGQTPNMFRDSKHSLLKMGYPAGKMKYYRGGMQAWTSLGLTVVGEDKR